MSVEDRRILLDSWERSTKSETSADTRSAEPATSMSRAAAGSGRLVRYTGDGLHRLQEYIQSVGGDLGPGWSCTIVKDGNRTAYKAIPPEGFQSADGNQHSAITGLVNVARALGLKVVGGRGSWGRARDAAIPSTGEGQQDNLDTRAGLAPPQLGRGQRKRRRKRAQQRFEPTAVQHISPVRASPEWGTDQPQLNPLPDSSEADISQGDVGGAVADTAAVLEFAQARIQGLEAELAAANAELAAAKAQVADKETQLTAMSMLVRERVSGSAAAP